MNSSAVFEPDDNEQVADDGSNRRRSSGDGAPGGVISDVFLRSSGTRNVGNGFNRRIDNKHEVAKKETVARTCVDHDTRHERLAS